MQRPKTAVAQVGRPVVLCVEDNEAQLHLLSDILARDWFAVIQAATPEEAIERLREAPVGLVIADHMLRGLTGAQLAAKFKAIKPTVPLMLHSGTRPESMHNVDAYLHKGEPTTELLRLARDLVRRFAT